MKRYYITDIVGDGSDLNPWRPVVADYNVSWVGAIPSDPNTGAPMYTWTLVMVDAQNHGQLIADSRIDSLPDFPLDGKVSAIQNNTKTAALAALSKRNIPTSVWSNSDGYRDVIRGIGKKLDASFDENNFDVTAP